MMINGCRPLVVVVNSRQVYPVCVCPVVVRQGRWGWLRPGLFHYDTHGALPAGLLEAEDVDSGGAGGDAYPFGVGGRGCAAPVDVEELGFVNGAGEAHGAGCLIERY